MNTSLLLYVENTLKNNVNNELQHKVVEYIEYKKRTLLSFQKNYHIKIFNETSTLFLVFTLKENVDLKTYQNYYL